VTFVEENDINFNPIGVRGIGQIGITGSLSNAVYHATRTRLAYHP